ncbi:MAG TPA: glycosyltransferase [Egibacteraceae bacterium]|nr:glycosyltransferase [Egibacteraceae bacterium]
MNVYIASLAQQLARAGVEVEIFTRAGGEDLPPTIRTADGARVHHIQAGPAGLAKSGLPPHLCAFYLGLAAHPASQALDLLHAHYWMSGWVGRKASGRLGVPLIQSFHTLARVKNSSLAPGEAPESALRIAAEDRVVATADALVAPTGEEAAILHDRYRARPGRVHVVEPGVDLKIFSPGDRQAARRSLGGGRIVLFVGRLQPLKSPDIAVRALAAVDRLLGEHEPPARLVICGGPSGDRAGESSPAGLRALASSLGIADRVALLGARPQHELAALYRAADVVIMPSRSESFGLVALEAQACGTPVVAAGVGGLRHVLAGGGGTLIAGHDPRDYAQALVEYLTDPVARQDASAAGRKRALAHSWERTAAGMLGVYRRVLERRWPAASSVQRGA